MTRFTSQKVCIIILLMKEEMVKEEMIKKEMIKEEMISIDFFPLSIFIFIRSIIIIIQKNIFISQKNDFYRVEFCIKLFIHLTLEKKNNIEALLKQMG